VTDTLLQTYTPGQRFMLLGGRIIMEETLF
jgi:hypothetical protein